jgi:thiamine biosynthesis lipoprotein
MPTLADVQSAAHRHVFETMGTTVSLAFAGPAPERAGGVVERVFAILDRRFSLYRADSEATAVARGELAIADASPSYRNSYALAKRWSAETRGAFTAHRPDGSIDLCGVIKAQAIRESATALVRLGARAWCLNAGGDVLTSGVQADGRPWVIGIVDPDDRHALVSQFTCATALPAVATSGTAERGEHVWRTASAPDFRQVTVAAPDIMTADVLATAILAGGRETLEHAVSRWPIEVLAATTSGGYVATAAFRG